MFYGHFCEQGTLMGRATSKGNEAKSKTTEAPTKNPEPTTYMNPGTPGLFQSLISPYAPEADHQLEKRQSTS